MNYVSAIIAVASIHLLAVMSPGPDFVLVSKNALTGSRRSGVFTSIGLGLGILTHVAYCLAGIGLIISQSILIFNTIKLIGAGYLIYIGIKAVLSKKSNDGEGVVTEKEISDWQAFKVGYIANVTNPKATLFMLSLFTLVIVPSTPLAVKGIMGLEMTIATIVWFSFVTFLLSHHLVKNRFARIQHRME